MPVTPKAILELLDELESSKQARLRAWSVLQRLRAVLTESGRVTIPPAASRTFEAEGALLEFGIQSCLSKRDALIKDLAMAARRIDQTAFSRGNEKADFPQAHQALLKILDRAAELVEL